MTVVAALTVTVNGPVPLHAALPMSVKVEPVAGVAVSVTTVPLANGAEHVAPQAIPVGALVTVPLPAASGIGGRVWRGRKVAVTVVSAPSGNVHGPVPEQPPPLQPVKVKAAAGVARRATG